MDLAPSTEPRKRGRPRKVPVVTGPTQAAQIADLIGLVKDLSAQQHQVLKAAMEAQKAQADVLKSWMAMFTPQGPSTSTSEMDREAIRAAAARDDWEPMATDDLSNLFSLPKV